MAKLNEFGIKVKHRLIDLEEPQTWLMMSFGDLTGIAVTGVWNKSLSRIEC